MHVLEKNEITCNERVIALIVERFMVLLDRNMYKQILIGNMLN